jgi:hypothetical protein
MSDSLEKQLSSLLNFDAENKQELLDNYLQSFRIRHNFIHAVVVDWLGLDKDTYMTERQIKTIFPDLTDLENVAKYTPDLCFKLADAQLIKTLGLPRNHWCIVDFSVSSTINLTSKKKEDKYSQIQEALLAHKINSSIFPFVLSPSLSNLEVQVHNFCNFFKIESTAPFPFMQCRLFFMELSNVQRTIREALRDPDLLMKVLELEYNDKTSNIKQDHLNQQHPLIKPINYESGHQSSKLEKTSFENLLVLVKNVINNKDVINTMSEIETMPDQISESLTYLEEENEKMFRKLKCPKPAIHILSHTFTHDIVMKHNQFKLLEQNQIFDFFYFLRDIIHDDDSYFSFLKDISSEFVLMMTHPAFGSFNRTVFETNHCLPIKESEEMHLKYHEYRSVCFKSHAKPVSFIEFLRGKTDLLIPSEEDSRAARQKIIRIPLNKFKSTSRAIWEKANSGNIRIKTFEDPQRESISLSQGFEFERFLDFLSHPKKKNFFSSPIEDFIKSRPGEDQATVFELKETMLTEAEEPMSLIKTTECYKFMWFQSLISEQLMHFSQLSISSNTFAVFTCGNPNQLVLMCNSFHDQGKDVGKAFLCFGLVDDVNWLNSTFGQVYSQEIKLSNKTFFLYCTNWRRLTTQKVTFIRDAFYMSLSTGLNAMLRNINEIHQNKFQTDPLFIKHFYTLKCVASISTSQRIGEMLADMRYAIMSSVAEFSSIRLFLLDKFKGPYKNTFEAWIVTRLKNLRDICSEFKTSILVILKQPTFSKNKRQHDSTGGEILIPSVWSRHINVNLQDFLDDMFLYVHTMKEPANIHHENIKAVNTILEFQEKYEALTDKRKMGDLRDDMDYINFLTDANILGFSRSIIYHSVEHFKSELPHKSWVKEWSEVKNEYLSEITNTKSVIPEYERKVEPFKKVSVRERLSKLSMHKSKRPIMDSEDPQEYFGLDFIAEFKKRMNVDQIIIKKPSRLKTKLSKSLVFQGTNRVKVHDAITDFIELHPEINTTFELGLWNMFKNSGRVTADICIKAQFGAKREFYVLNLGAKAMARVLESFFQKICLITKQEMISVPGDKKMLVMQDVINNMIFRKKGGQQLFFVNGDCTKWSAAELMECLYVFISDFEGFIPEEARVYCLNVISLWARKEITVPVSILAQTFIKTAKTAYLKDGEFSLKSTQNFLQGMFNYLSSLKAVCCSNFTYKLWKSLYPESRLQLEHLEHSDDYLLVLLVTSIDELKKFRLLHRIMMKCHGFNDSIKKTNTQKFLMEFISLCSFNGHMTYPHIKKVKEVGLNLGCIGYKDDMDTVISRVGESVRIGVPFCNAYIMQRIHQYNLIRAYSLHNGGKNSCDLSYTERFNLPQEVMGIPDLHPIFLFLCKGNPNNYRLSEYSSQRRCLRYLLFKEIFLIENSDDKRSNPNDEGLKFYHPFYTFDAENKLIRKIRRQLDISVEDLEQFWESHKSYNFIKPNNHDCLLQWLKCMYYRSNFSLAYSRNSRSQITLRLSTFTLTKCLKETMNSDELSTISEYIKSSNLFEKEMLYKEFVYKKFTKSERHQLYIKALLNCDTTVTAVYSLFNNSRIAYKGNHNKYSTASLSPHKLLWLNIDNSPQTLLQYIFNFEDFKLDNRPYRGLASLEADKQKLEDHYQRILSNNTDIATMKSVFRDLVIAKDRQVLCMSFQTESNTLEGFIKDQLEFNTYHNVRLKLITMGITKALNPHTGESFYQKTMSFTRDDVRLILDDLGLVYGLLKHGYKCKEVMIKQTLNNLVMKSPFEDTRVSKSMTISEVLMSYTSQTLTSLGCTSSELKTFCFLKAFMTDDPTELELILTERFSYSYKYITFLGSSGEDKEINQIKEQATITYNNITYKVVKLVTGLIVVYTNQDSRAGLLNVYLIAQKMFGDITQHKLEQLLGSTRFEGLPKVTINHIPKLHLNDKVLRATEPSFVEYSKVKPSDTIHPIVHTAHRITETSDKRGYQKVHPRFKINWETSTVYSGSEKIFTLPYLAYRQTNLSSVIGDLRLNGTNLNWWLTHDRIHDFIHGLEIQADDSFFDNLSGFKARKASELNGDLTHLMNFYTKGIPSQLPKSKNTSPIMTHIHKTIGNIPKSTGEELLGEDELSDLINTLCAEEENLDMKSNSSHNRSKKIETDIRALEGTSASDLRLLNKGELMDIITDIGTEDQDLNTQLELNSEVLDQLDIDLTTFELDLRDISVSDSRLEFTGDQIIKSRDELNQIDLEAFDLTNLELKLTNEDQEDYDLDRDNTQLSNTPVELTNNEGLVDIISKKEDDVKGVDDDNHMIILNDISDENWEEQTMIDVFDFKKKKNEHGLLTFDEFDLGVANFITSETTNIRLPQSVKMISDRGDPTEYIIKTAYVDKTQLFQLSPAEKIAVIIMLKSIVEVHTDMNDKEKTLILRLMTVINNTFKEGIEYDWYNDWIIKRIDGILYGFLKVNDVKDEELIRRAKEKNSIMSESESGGYDLLICVSQKKIAEWMKHNLKIARVENFVNIRPLENLYKKCFKQKYHQVLDAYEMLEDL